jgi:hypothetical protein
MVVVSPRSADDRTDDCGPENNGAGGRGRMGLPPYLDDGVPGRGLPLRSAGSYGMLDGGGRDESDDVRDGEYIREGEFRRGMNGKYEGASAVGGAIVGAVSRMEGDRDRGRDAAEGWYDRRGDRGDSGLLKCSGGEPCFLNFTRMVERRLGFSWISPPVEWSWKPAASTSLGPGSRRSASTESSTLGCMVTVLRRGLMLMRESLAGGTYGC